MWWVKYWVKKVHSHWMNASVVTVPNVQTFTQPIGYFIFYFSYFHNYQIGYHKQLIISTLQKFKNKKVFFCGRTEKSLKLHAILFIFQETNKQQYLKHDTLKQLELQNYWVQFVWFLKTRLMIALVTRRGLQWDLEIGDLPKVS